MATGSGIQPGRGVVTTNITPTVNLDTGEAQAWDAARRTFDRFTEAAKPNLIRRAQAAGREEGAAVARGEQEMPRQGLLAGFLGGGEVAEARSQALQTAYVATVRNDIDARERELRLEFQLDPEGYQAAAREMVSGFIQGAVPEYAVDVEAYATDRINSGFGSIAEQRQLRDQQETTQALGVRIATLDERMVALASRPGGMETEEFAAARLEREQLQDERAANPAILYSDDQRFFDDDRLETNVLGASVTRLAIEAYSDGGSGLPGTAAALRFLRDEVLEGEAFANVTPEQRQRVYREARQQVDDFARADREEERQRRADEAAARAEQRERRGELRLAIMLGEVSESDILSDEGLSEGDRATLVASARAQRRREQTEARAIQAQEAANRRAIYGEYRDQAQAGTLTPAELADAVEAETLTRGQARTLQGLNDNGLRPVVADVMAPVLDAGNRPGRDMTAEQRAIAEEQAVLWARANPTATLEQRLAQGRVISQRIFGANAEGRPSGQGGVDQIAQLRALSQERQQRAASGRAMTTAEYNRRRNEIINGSQ